MAYRIYFDKDTESFVAEEQSREIKPGQLVPEFEDYYVDYESAMDAVKFRNQLWQMHEEMLKTSFEIHNDTREDNIMFQISSLEEADRLLSLLTNPNGTFNCLLGDEIKINDGTYNKKWIVVGFNTQSKATSQPHISLIPVDSLGNYVMNSKATNISGYVGSKAFITCETVANNLATVLGDHLLTRNELLGNSGYSSFTTVTKAVRVNLLNEIQVFGSRTYSVASEDGYDTVQLPGFRLNKVSKTISSYSDWWLRSACSGNSFYVCIVDSGSPNSSYANYSVAFRPLITIG